MELLPELYLYILILADDVNITKKLRILTKQALYACNEYNKLLLNQRIYMNFDSYYWALGNEDNFIKNITKNHSHHFTVESVMLFTSNAKIDMVFQKIVKYNHEYLDRYFYEGPYSSNAFKEPTAFKMTIKELYSSIS